MMGSEALLLGLWVVQIFPTWFVVRKVGDKQNTGKEEHRENIEKIDTWMSDGDGNI